MSEAPLETDVKQVSPLSNNMRTILFMVALSFVCAFILSILASVLAEPILIAKDLDRSRQMLIAAKILDHEGHFIIQNDKGEYVNAVYEKGKGVVAFAHPVVATNAELLAVYKERLIPMLLNDKGELKTFKEAHVNEEEYLAQYRKIGYYLAPNKLLYLIHSNKTAPDAKDAIEGYVIPINGFGLWDAIYGYLAIATDGNTIIGMTWYDQKETPGLGANIADAPWQQLFYGKKLFQASSDGHIDYKTAPLGITVVKGKVSEVLGNVPKANSAVDGMAGATLTGNGVNDAFKNVLAAYRPFLLKLQHKE